MRRSSVNLSWTFASNRPRSAGKVTRPSDDDDHYHYDDDNDDDDDDYDDYDDDDDESGKVTKPSDHNEN